MNKAIAQLEKHLHLYMRSGGKTSRKRQAQKMRIVIGYMVEKEKVKGLEQIGRKQVSRFYRDNRHLAPSTRRDYYYAINVIWRQFLQRASEPPLFK
ncbi:hypothetical protein ACP3V5_25255 [Vibrio maritimus]